MASTPSRRAAFLDWPIGIWWAGLNVGLKALPHEPVLGLKRVVLPVSYWRSAEFAYACRQLHLPAGARVLDVGSPKDLPAHLAMYRGYSVTATDILDSAIALSRRLARARGIEGKGPGLVFSETQDGRSLPYQTGSFDAAISISVLEHIPETGDTQAIAELVRCVRPGGRVVVTTPFSEKYEEVFVNHSVYERAQEQEAAVFYERHYDEAALQERLLKVQGARVIHLAFWGERGLRWDHLMMQHRTIRKCLSPLEPILGAATLREVTATSGGRRMAAFVTLEKLA